MHHHVCKAGKGCVFVLRLAKRTTSCYWSGHEERDFKLSGVYRITVLGTCTAHVAHVFDPFVHMHAFRKCRHLVLHPPVFNEISSSRIALFKHTYTHLAADT